MKAAILLICGIVIFQTQADVQESDYSELCKQCKGSTLPKCERTDDVRINKTIECQQAGCIIAMATDAESDYMCLIAVESSEVTLPQFHDNSSQWTTLPLPLALQTITTTESSKEASQEAHDSADAIEVSDDEVIEMAGPGQQAEGSGPVKVASEETESKPEQEQSTEEKSAEKEDDSKPAGTEVKPEQTSDADSAEEVAPDSESAAAPEPVYTPNSPDYPADEPPMPVTNTNTDMEQHIVPAEVQHHAVENESGKAGNTFEVTEPQNAGENNGEDQQALETNKGEELANNGEQSEMNEDGGKVPDHTAHPAHGSDGHEETQVEAATIGATNVLNTEPAVVVMSTLAPAGTTAAQFLICYSCTSSTDTRCAVGTGKAINCQAKSDKQNGCYTLTKADTNITTRGCISELTDDGLKYCISNSKQCILCYEKACNNLLAPSDATKSNAMLSFLLGIASFMCFTFLL